MIKVTTQPSSYDGRYPRVYAALKRYGFSPAMAIRVIIDATRGDWYAWRVVKLARHYRAADTKEAA